MSYIWNIVFKSRTYPHSRQGLQLSSELPLLLHPLNQLQKSCIASSCVAPLKQFTIDFTHKKLRIYCEGK